MLYVLMKANGVWAEVMSKSALAILAENGTELEYETLTDNIINRSGTGLCPMEQAVRDIDDPHAAYEAIKQRLDELSETEGKR